MVSRVVPRATANPLEMVAEDYNEWTVDAAAFRGPPLDLVGMELVDNQEARLARKFFMHNSAHAICGYWGFHRGHKYVHEAIDDPFVLERVTEAIEELAQVVSYHYGFELNSVRAYGLTLGERGAVAELKDSILRVVRDPLRKLSRRERLVAPAELALQHKLTYVQLVRGLAALLHYYHPADPQSVRMREKIADQGPQVAIPELIGLPPTHPLTGQIVAEYCAWVPVPAASPTVN